MEKIINDIRDCILLKGLNDDEITSFIQTYECKIIEYSKDECIISKDEPPQYIGVVLKGTVGIYSDSIYGGHTLIDIGDSNYLFGFIAMFFNEHKSITTLYCRDNCKIAYFTVSEFLDPYQFLENTNNKILVNIFAVLTAHIRKDFNRMHIISTYSVLAKFSRYLISRYNITGETTFNLIYTKTELANYLGVYRTSLSHCIKKLGVEKIVSISGTTVNILKLESLYDIESESLDY